MPKTIPIYDIVGSIMHESIAYANATDLYLSPWGAGLIKIAGIAEKPGVIHTNKKVLKKGIPARCWWLIGQGNKAQIPAFIDESSVSDVKQEIQKTHSEKRNQLDDYDCDWRVILKELQKLILKIDSNN